MIMKQFIIRSANTTRRFGHLLAIVIAILTGFSAAGGSLAQSKEQRASGDRTKLETDFQHFLDDYWLHVRQRDREFLRLVHPKLPQEMYEFFFDVTLDMVRHSEARAGIEPSIECQEFNVCKVVYPQPNDSWAAQRFILHRGAWQWLDQ